jgi:hypothetical protein
MHSATRDLVNSHGSAARTRLLRLSAVGLAIVALAVSSVTASADTFTLPPTAGTANAGCGIFSLFCEAVAGGSLVGSPGTFAINEHGDVTCDPAVFNCIPATNQLCYPLTGSTTLTSGGDVLVLVSKPSIDTFCATQPMDALGAPVPGPWPFALTFGVDPSSQGIYANKTGNGSLKGTWTPDPKTCPDPCGLGLSDSLALTFTQIDVALLPSGGGCDPNDPLCNGGVGATPELDSILLFGSGLSGIVAYAVGRWRAANAGKLI